MVEIPCNPPLFHENKLIADFRGKREIFNSLFAKQCTLIDNRSTLPSLFHLIADKSLLHVDFSIEDVKIIISKLNSNKSQSDNWSEETVC